MVDNYKLLSGYSYDKNGPYLIIDDLEQDNRTKMYVRNKTFTIMKLKERFCIGTYDLDTFQTHICSSKSSLEINEKSNYCDACITKNGFNPAFYNSNNISPQQRKYNNTEHIVYLAYFAKDIIKVGIASKKRASVRLLEQGARAAIIVRSFPNAYLARELEAQLNKEYGIPDNINHKTKIKLLKTNNFLFEDAKKEMKLLLSKLNFKIPGENEFIDLSPYYFGDNSIDTYIYSPLENMTMILSGQCLGLIGDILILRQQNVQYGLSIKNFISYLVDIRENTIDFEYDTEPIQISLFSNLLS